MFQHRRAGDDVERLSGEVDVDPAATTRLFPLTGVATIRFSLESSVNNLCRH